MKTHYVGMDVHKATIVIAVLDAKGKVVSQSIIETSTQAVRDYFKSWRGVKVTSEEGNQAACLTVVVKPLVGLLVVCIPKHNNLLNQGGKNDRIDAGNLTDSLNPKQL